MKLFCTTEINVHFYKKFLHLSQSLRRRKNKTIDSQTTINRIKRRNNKQPIKCHHEENRGNRRTKAKSSSANLHIEPITFIPPVNKLSGGNRRYERRDSTGSGETKEARRKETTRLGPVEKINPIGGRGVENQFL